MKIKFLKLICIFVIVWVIGQACKSTYSENLMFSLTSTFGFSIFLGLHSDLKSYLSEKLDRFLHKT